MFSPVSASFARVISNPVNHCLFVFISQASRANRGDHIKLGKTYAKDAPREKSGKLLPRSRPLPVVFATTDAERETGPRFCLVLLTGTRGQSDV